MSENKAGSGVGFTSLLLLLFIGLKLGGVIHWSWWWVLSPIWLPFAVVLVAVAFLSATAAVMTWMDAKDRTWVRKGGWISWKFITRSGR